MSSAYRNSVVFQEINDILYRNDPIGLARMGAPSDEYELEADKIYENLTRKKYATIHGLRKMVHQVFVDCFNETKNATAIGIAGTEETYQQIASDIFDLIYK